MKDLNWIHWSSGGLDNVASGAGGHPGSGPGSPGHEWGPGGRGRGHHPRGGHHRVAGARHAGARASVCEADHGASVSSEADGRAVTVTRLRTQGVLLKNRDIDLDQEIRRL